MLHELQSAMRHAILSGDPAGVVGTILGDRVPAPRRLAIHRSTVVISLIATLRAAFPLTAARLGEPRFAACARGYVESAPPRQPQLSRYGESFPVFLAGQTLDDPASPDLARLEWARVEAFFAPDAPCLDLAALSAVASERLPGVVLRLHPSVRLVASRHALLDLWHGAPGDPPPGHDANGVVVLRAGSELAMHALSAGDLAMLRAVRGGATLGAAADAAITAEPAFDLSAALAAMLTRNVFASFSFTRSERARP